MPTSSITKDFFVKDQEAFARLKKDLESVPERKHTVESPALKEGQDLLDVFVFREK